MVDLRKITPSTKTTSFVPKPLIPNVTNGLVLGLDAGNTSSYPGSGSTWTDFSGNASNATLFGGFSFDSSNQGSLVFNGSNAYADCGTSSNFSITSAGTVCAWFKKPWASGYKGLIDKGRDGYGAWSLCVDETANVATFKARISGTNRSVNASSNYGNNTWTHVCGVFDGINLSIYQNGILSNSAQFSGTIGTNAVSVRVGAANDGLFFSGNISQAYIYNRVLTSQEILQNFRAQSGRYGI